jgi:Flp pilus assembly protein TadD
LLQLDRNQEALDSFDRALSLNPGDKRVLNAQAFARKKITTDAARQDKE